MFTFIDLFAGIGGMRLGFEALGGLCVFTSEWDDYSRKSYHTNFPHDEHPFAGDITAVGVADVPDHVTYFSPASPVSRSASPACRRRMLSAARTVSNVKRRERCSSMWRES